MNRSANSLSTRFLSSTGFGSKPSAVRESKQTAASEVSAVAAPLVESVLKKSTEPSKGSDDSKEKKQSHSSSGQEKLLECCLCMFSHPLDEIYTVDCIHSHKFCFECIGRYVEIGIRENTPLVCPAEGCDHILTEDEVEQISHGPRSPVTESMVKKYQDQLLMRAVQNISGSIGCPTPGCGNWMVLSDPKRRERCMCSACGACFCSLCKAPYHYECDCSSVRKIQQKWIDWNTKGRLRYNRDKQEALEYINSVRAEIESKNKAMMKRYNDMLADEEFKRNNARYCPNCHRVIIKEGGCDVMRCGRDYHGGNVQDGCGHQFDWAMAEPYQSVLEKPTEEKQDIDIPEIAREYVHEGIACDRCHQVIKGLRFRCINCPTCDFCEKCELQGTMAHDKDHIFEIMTKEGSN